MSNPIFDAWVKEAFKKVAWPYNPEDVAHQAPQRVARNIRRGGSILSGAQNAAEMIPKALSAAGNVANKILAPAGNGALRAMGHVGTYFRKHPGLMRLGVGTAAVAPILWGAFNETQQGFEKELMAMNRDPSRVITASLDEFLEKKAFQGQGDLPFNGPGVSGSVKGRFYNIPQDLGTKTIDSFTGGISQGVGMGVANGIFSGLGKLLGGIRDAVVTNPKRLAMVETLMRNDPVISDAVNRNPHGHEIVMEAYGTMTRFAPKLSTDINAARSFLREAVLGGSGVNYATIKNLIETERSLSGYHGHKD